MPCPSRWPQPRRFALRLMWEQVIEMKSSISSRLRKNSMLQSLLGGVFLGGAALQRCGKSIALNAALAAEVAHSARELVFPQRASRRMSLRRWLQAAALTVAVVIFIAAGDT